MKKVLLCILLLCTYMAAISQNPILLKDVYPGATGSGTQQIVKASNDLLFDAEDAADTYPGLFRTDGGNMTKANSFSPTTFDNWGVVGSATPNGWGAGPDIPLTYDAISNTWSAVVSLSNGEIKFRANNEWSVNYGDNGADGTLEANGNNIAVAAGSYLITLNLATLNYSIASVTKAYYVNDNSTIGDLFTSATGSNTNTGTKASPFTTLTYALSQAGEGDTIYVDAGAYAEQVIINKGVSIIGAGQTLTSFIPPATALVPAPGPFSEIGLFETTQSIGDVNISHISINSNGGSQNIIIQSGGSVSNCTLLNGQQGIFFRIASGTKSALIEKNNIQPTGIGINCQGNGLTATIRQNTISNTVSYYAGIFAGLDFGPILQLTANNNIISNYSGNGFLANSFNSNFTQNSIVGLNGQGVAIQQFSGNTANASCNWFGSSLATAVAPKIIGDVTFSPWLINGTDNSPAVGFQTSSTCTVANSYYVNDNNTTGDVFTTAVGNNINAGTFNAPYATLDHALTQVPAGATIYVDAGAYTIPAINITKSVTILGPNHTVSPNNASNKAIYNTERNTEARLTGGALNIGADWIFMNGLRFTPTTTAINMSGNFSHIKFNNNYFDVVSAFPTVLLQGSTSSPSIVAFDFMVTDNRFERMDNGTGITLLIGNVRSMWVDNNTFIESGPSFNRSVGLRTLNPFSVDGLAFTNNYLKKLNQAVNVFTLQNSTISANKFDSTSQGIIYSPSNLVSNNVSINNNQFTNLRQGRAVLVRGGSNAGINNLNVSNNSINLEVNGTGGIVGLIQLEFTAANTFGAANVIGNKINISGDYSQTNIGSTCGIILTGKHANTTISFNELNFTAINAGLPLSLTALPPVPAGIFINTDGTSANGLIPASAVINIANNKINGFKQSVAIYDPIAGLTPQIGYGYLTSGATININNNSFTGDSLSIDNGTTSQSVSATCNWYGSAFENDVKLKVTGTTVQSIPWLTSGTDNDVATGHQPLPNNCNGYSGNLYVNDNSQTGDVFTTSIGNNNNPGTATAPFGSLDYAISLAKNGDTIYVDAGTYSAVDFTINKSVSILGTNYLLSPNDAGNPSLINSIRNAEAVIENITWTIGANNINLEGLTFNPNNKQAIIMNNTNFGNIKLSKNRFRINSSLIQVSITGNGSTATSPAGIVNGGLTIADNRFEKLDAGGGTSLGINRFKGIGITNNVFVVAGETFRTQIATSFGSSGVVDGLYCANNTFDNSSSAFSGARIGNAFITGNTINNTTNAFVVTNSIPESSDIFFVNNIINGSAGILPFIQYNRTNGAAAGAVSNFTIENNIITANAVAGTTTILGSMNLIFQNSVLNPRLTVGGNVINYGGDLSTVPAHFIRPIMLRGNLVNAVIEKNEINLTGINQQQRTAGVDLPVSPAITLHPDNGPTSFLQSGSVINIRNNKINGFKHSFAVYDALNGRDTYIGYGNIYSGVTVNVNNNSFNGDSISINNGSIAAATVINAICNWYGSALAEEVKKKISIADVQYIPWLTNGTDNDVAKGFQPVANACNGYPSALYVNDNDQTGDVFTSAVGYNSNPGTAAAPVATLTEAISRAKAGDTIYVDAGTYVENLTINKSLVIRGVKYGQNPGSSLNRGNESVFYPSFNLSGLNGNAIVFKTTANNITIDGFTIDGDNPTITGGQLVNGVDCNAGVAVFNDNVFISNLAVINNIVKNTSAYGIGQFKALGNQTSPAVTGALFRNNRVHNIGSRGIVLGYNAYGAIENNNITNVNNSGIWIAQHTLANPSGLPVRVSGNIISANILGIQLSAVSGSAPRVEVFNNEVTMPATGFGLSLISNSSGASFTNNKVVGGLASVLTNTSLAITPISFNNNSFTGYAEKIIETSAGTAQINAGCNWYGSSAVQDFYTKFNTNYVSFITWLTNGTDNDAASGFQPVPGACDGYPTLITFNGSTNITCNGAANGSINITTSYGKSPFTYTWTKEGDANFVSHNEDPTGLAAGTYTLSIVDGNGSNIYITDPEADGPGTITVTITEPSVLIASASGSNNVCFNGTTGSSSVSASGGTAPYTYAWSNGATAQSISNLAAGVYNITVTDANGCTTTASYEVTQPTQVTASITNSSTACSNIATITAGGGTPDYTYLWSNGSTSATISGVPVGTYTVTVTDANGCTATATITLTVAEAFNPSASVTNVTCFAANNGIITVTNINGTAPFMFSKDGGVSFENGSLPFSFINLAPGNYTIAVKDANGCVGFVERTVTQPTALTATIGSIQSTCFGSSTGAINVTVSGGVPAYSYSWTGLDVSFSSSQLNISSLAAGNYRLTVTDKNNCTYSVDVLVPTNPEILVNETISHVSCRGGANGSIAVNATGGSNTNFSYLWNTGATTATISNLAPGNYSVAVTDNANSCVVNKSFTITQPALALSLATAKTNATGCNSLGTITATGSGGTAPYTYSVNVNGSAVTGNSIGGLYAGDYTVTVTDANGCTTSKLVTITDNGSDEYEGNNSKNQAKPISVGTAINARLALSNDAADWFTFTAPGSTSGLYSVKTTHPDLNVVYTVSVFASGKNTAALVPVSVITSGESHYQLTAGTTYFVSITTTTLSNKCYSFSVSALEPIEGANRTQNNIATTPSVDILKAFTYPNPHNGNFTLSIESPEEGVATVELYTVNGQKLSERKANVVVGKGNTVKYSNMNYAILFYKVRIGKHTVTGKIISPN